MVFTGKTIDGLCLRENFLAPGYVFGLLLISFAAFFKACIKVIQVRKYKASRTDTASKSCKLPGCILLVTFALLPESLH